MKIYIATNRILKRSEPPANQVKPLIQALETAGHIIVSDYLWTAPSTTRLALTAVTNLADLRRAQVCLIVAPGYDPAPWIEVGVAIASETTAVLFLSPPAPIRPDALYLPEVAIIEPNSPGNWAEALSFLELHTVRRGMWIPDLFKPR